MATDPRIEATARAIFDAMSAVGGFNWNELKPTVQARWLSWAATGLAAADACGARERDEARAEAARYREALERITAAHVAGASAGELADRARGVLRGGGGHDGEQAAVLERDEARARAKKADEALAFWQRGAKDAARYQEALEQIRDGRWNQPGERLTAREFARDALGGGDD